MTEEKLAETMSEYEGMPLRDVVFRTLRKSILRGDLHPGERLMEIQLANRLGVSRTPIREAIRMLELEGLVTNIPRRGAQVAKITEKDLRDVLEVREALEELTVRLACERITERQLSDLYRASRKFEAVVDTMDLVQLAQADEEFHTIIYEASGNRRLVQMINNLREQMYRYRVEYLKDAENRQSLITEHDELWESLKRKDFASADKYMKRHIERQMINIRSSLH
uniref:GntR family transcriptional regulator n=1 Tax=Eubacterium cellulosolvens TaxID=29322 RepID=UPI0004817FC1|nr:GntR family transcriptional regulator [[Eubacterium] cellulosolvens]